FVHFLEEIINAKKANHPVGQVSSRIDARSNRDVRRPSSLEHLDQLRRQERLHCTSGRVDAGSGAAPLPRRDTVSPACVPASAEMMLAATSPSAPHDSHNTAAP